ncbi:hypothetical protein ACHAPT_002320 [Fusarium lateritium]
MCQAIRYVYPDCRHPIVPDPDVWDVERCRRAHATNRDCWMPHDLHPDFIQHRVWTNGNLTEPCENSSFEESSDEDDDEQADTNGQDTTQSTTEMDDSLNGVLDLGVAQAIQRVVDRLAESDDEQEPAEEDLPDDHSLGSASMDLEGSQPSETEYH